MRSALPKAQPAKAQPAKAPLSKAQPAKAQPETMRAASRGHLTARLPDQPTPPNLLPTVLLTGFEAFGGDSVNPSWLAVQQLVTKNSGKNSSKNSSSTELLAGHQILVAQLPTSFAASSDALARLLRQHRPAVVLCVGLAGGRSGLSLERIAINIQDARIADNDGLQPIDTPVVASSPAAYFTTLPIKAMCAALTHAGIEASISQSAGTFVCNHVFYALLHALRRRRAGPNETKVRGGFIHVPYLPGQGLPCMPLDEMVRGLQIALRCAVSTTDDIAVSGGALN